MINYFHKISHFDIDGDMLYKEWFDVATKHDMFNRTQNYKTDTSFVLPFYYKLLINHPNSSSPDMDPVWIQGGHNNSGEIDKNYDIDNIIKDFQGSYTEKVAKEVARFLINKYPTYDITTIKYAVLEPKTNIGVHIDGNPIPRFFLSVSAPEGCYMEVCGEKHPLNETGSLFRMMCNVPHDPVNHSDGYRVMMTFDVRKKVLP